MARRIAFNVWCDLCPRDHPVRAEHVNLPIAVGPTGPLTLDLCELHYKELLQPVLDALLNHGEKPVPRVLGKRTRIGQKRLYGPYRCLAGCTSAPLKNYITLTSHLRLIHDGMTLDEYVAKYGELVPLEPEDMEPVEVRCEIQDCDQAYSTATGTRWPQQAMVSHMRGRHGLKWKPGMPFDEATRIG